MSWPSVTRRVLEVFGVPAEGPQHGHDEGGLRVLLADALAAIAGDLVAHGREDALEIRHWLPPARADASRGNRR